ncbi:FAD binding domain-containing protein [Tothia fuscella]|uniref:FAD binding domain-containing protein n=1 Tax=Tothia fuscella TaxID=1048955 RepID=A0A9P4NJY4_9PEZI|nr:FAD binding domain-containing protein [Tothia fuscella]
MPQQSSHRVLSSKPNYPETSIPEEPEIGEPQFTISLPPTTENNGNYNGNSSDESLTWSDGSIDSEAPLTPQASPQVGVGEVDEKLSSLTPATITTLPTATISPASSPTPTPGKRRASTTLISKNGDDIRRLLGTGEAGTKLIEKYCCGEGCCMLEKLSLDYKNADFVPVEEPDNAAYKHLGIKLEALSLDTKLTNLTPLPESTISFDSVPSSEPQHTTTLHVQPPSFVKPHPPYDVFSAPVFGARELTKPGAEKRTFHFDLDVTDYPDEGEVDFKVGGAIGVCPPNDTEVVDDVFDMLGIPKFIRNKSILLRTGGGRWPTIWGEEKPRELVTTRRELLTWCCDIQSTPPVKPLFRLLSEYASAPNEKKILAFLASAQGQAAFCDLRTGPHITLAQLLHAFPSSKPPLDAILSLMKQLMPRFYSLSNDPIISASRGGLAGGRRLIEMAVSVHETPDWRSGSRTGVGSGFLERIAHKFIEAQASGLTGEAANEVLDIRVPMFRGLMSNPLSREFMSDGPMMLIGAGVGMAPFRGFILNRLKNANCANKIWLVQGVRDSNLDEIYSGELGDHEKEIKKVVQSRKPNKARLTLTGDEKDAKYVQDEVRNQADIVWFVINALDGRVFVCGSSKGMGEGVHEALVEVTMAKGALNREQAETFWVNKKDSGQYIAETW